MIPPVLRAIQHVRWSLSRGRPLSESLDEYLRSDASDLSERLRELRILHKNAQLDCTTHPFQSHYACAFWELLQRGLQGQPIHDPLQLLENEVLLAAQAELDRHIATLPFKTLLPLLAFQFPAFLLILLGPILRDLNSSLGGL